MTEFDVSFTARWAGVILAQIGHERGGLKWGLEIWGPTEAQRRYEGRMARDNSSRATVSDTADVLRNQLPLCLNSISKVNETLLWLQWRRPIRKMDISQAKLEAIKLIKDWSSWMVGVQTALIGAVMFGKLWGNADRFRTFHSALVCFTLSIICAGILMGGLPEVVERIPQMSSVSVYDECLTIGKREILGIRFLIIVQHLLFVAGLLYLLGHVRSIPPSTSG